MNDTDYIYVMVSFPDRTSLERAVESLSLPSHRVAVLGNEASGAAETARALDLRTRLDPEIHVDDGQDERLQWHTENKDHPILAVGVMAEEGREVRQRLEKMGGRPIDMPLPNLQVGDEAMDPGMSTEEPSLPPQRGRTIDPEHKDADHK